MAKVRSPWRALRPLLLAGAVTATWLTLSASAATADSSRDSGPLLVGVTSSVASLTAPLTGAVTPIPEAASPAPSPTGFQEPVVGSADHLTAAVPVANSVVPTGTVTSVAVPVAAVADADADGLVETVAPKLTEALPVLEPVLHTVVDLVDATVPSLPATLTDLPVDEIAVAGDVSTASEAAAAPTTAAAQHTSHDASSNSMGLLAATGTSSAPSMTTAEIRSAAPGSPWTGDPSTPPAPSPAGPASGTGSGASPSGPSGSAPWLDELGFHLPLLGSFPISGSTQHAPSPVAFDPGSSPD